MCGISALFKFDGIKETDCERLAQMNKEMSYRGPDDSGVWNNATCGLAHTRLSIIGLDNGHQPIFNEDQKIVLVCNGEIYNYKQLVAQLQLKGHIFKTRSDCEVIVHLYEEYGTECLSYLRGMFAFCLYDGNRNLLFCARDRIGEKTLYYSQIPCGFVFSTELKAIVKQYIDKPQVDVKLLAESIRFGYPLELKHTYIEQVNRLQPGEYAVVDSCGIETHTYWHRYNLPNFQGTLQEAENETLRIIRESVANCLQSDVPVAVLLSGGIDSSAIAHFAKETGKEIHCICAGYKGDYCCDERNIAREFAKEKGLFFHEVELDASTFQDIYHEYNSYLDEPVADIASIAQWALYKKAKELGFTVLLGGLGGDELFYGYPPHNRCGEALEIRRKLVCTRSRTEWLKCFVKNLRLVDPHRRMRLDDRWPVDWTLPSYNSFADTATIDINGEMYRLRDFHVNFDYPYEADINNVYDMQLYRFMTTQCLYLADRLGMGNSMEVRSPLVDYKLVEFVSSLPIEMKYKKGKPKQFLKNILHGLVPDHILYGTKKGFTPPMDFIQQLCKKYEYKIMQSDYVFFNSMFADNILSNVLL